MASRSTQHLNDQRSNHRYPVEVALEYRVELPNRKVVTGVGGTVNLSTSGVLFQSADSLPRGVAIELSIAWPARLNNIAGLNLHVVGKTVRTEGNCTAVIVQRHEFRTQGMTPHDTQSASAASPGTKYWPPEASFDLENG
jgi:hypothetical protein